MRISLVIAVGVMISFSLSNAVRAQSVAPAAPQQSAAPASSTDISGKWHFVYQTDGGERDSTANFKQDGDQVTGKYNAADVKGTFKDGDMDLAFPYDSDEAGMKATLKMKGKLKDGKLVGNWQFADYDGTFVATRAE